MSIVLRGMGLSSHPEDGYEKTSQAHDLASILDHLTVDQVILATHDIGIVVGYAFAAQFPQRVTNAQPGAIHNAFGGQFAAFARDAEENKALFAKAGKLRMPVLAIGGDHSYGASMKSELEFVASDVQGAVITDSGHWIMEEQPQQAIAIITNFIARK